MPTEFIFAVHGDCSSLPPASRAGRGALSAAAVRGGHRLAASTAIHKGDRSYQQDQVTIFSHEKIPGCVVALVADGMGGKSGGRKASDQTMMTARQVFERFSPNQDDAKEMLRQMALEAHLMIKLTAISAEQEPHSTIAGALILPDLRCVSVHAGDSRVYRFRGPEMMWRSTDHSYVQRLMDEGQLTEEEAANHPQSNLLTGCLGTAQEPPVAVQELEPLQVGDSVMACSDGLWHYFTPKELGVIVHSLSPRDACELLINKARQRARGGGDNLSLALIKVEAAPPPKATLPPLNSIR